MNALDYLKLANAPEAAPARARAALVTNFTDGIIGKLMRGVARAEGIELELFTEPYRQYHFSLGNPGSALAAFDADMTFIVFDMSPYRANEFSIDKTHVEHVLRSVESYARNARGQVVLATLPVPPRTGADASSDPLTETAAAYNAGIRALAQDVKNISVLDFTKLIAEYGDDIVRDLRGLYAFDTPFTNEFSLTLAQHCLSYLFALKGRAKKCIVVDLDNTLWGGIVGEVGTQGIVLGDGYPGLAYQEFQRALLSYHDRGVILAIASRNNVAEVDDVFAARPEMVLQKKHFASMQIHWRPKSESIAAIAQDLNIGLDSIVFLDDDAANREEVKAALPEVLVPDLPAAPERYARTLYRLTCFSPFPPTEEDREKGRMYAEERERKTVMHGDSTAYLAKLGIVVSLSRNDMGALPRIAQLTQKTNQCNLTTQRYTEADIAAKVARGAHVYAATVHDAFGAYGLVAVAIVEPVSAQEARLDTFLMSCRVMGRGVEHGIMDAVITDLAKEGYTVLTGSYRKSAKNAPVAEFLPTLGFTMVSEEAEETTYRLDLTDYAPSDATGRVLPLITVTRTYA